MPSTKLILVRHGETDDNRNFVFQGQEGRGLNGHGRDQAARLAARLVAIHACPDALYASDLERARETADILGRALGLTPQLEPELREVSLGAWQGLSHDEVAARFPAEWAAWQRGEDLKRGGGESYAELGERLARVIARVADAHAGRAALIVSHGASLKIFVARVLGLATPGLRTFRVMTNTGVTVVERTTEGTYRLLVWNDVAHLHDGVAEALAGS